MIIINVLLKLTQPVESQYKRTFLHQYIIREGLELNTLDDPLRVGGKLI